MPQSPVLQKVEAALRQSALSPEQSLLVALSGGADSVCLLLALHELGFTIEAAHCNFHLRGAESDADETLVRSLCQRLGIRLHVRHFDTQAEAHRRHISLEMAARDLRYDWFSSLLTERRLEVVAVAHHRADNAETFLLNLVRGTGLQGLTGMKLRNGRVVRPLLSATREEIEAYLARCGQDYATDSTNADPRFRRNRLRRDVLPVLRQLNPSFDLTLERTMSRLTEADILMRRDFEAFRQRCVVQHEGETSVSIKALLSAAAPHSFLYYLLSEQGFTSAQCDAMSDNLTAPSGQLYESPTAVATLHRGTLRLASKAIAVGATPLPCGTTLLPDGRTLNVERTEAAEVSRQPLVATLDADALQGTLFVRTIAAADRFRPYGLAGSKLVADYLKDRHRSRLEKQRALVVCDAAGIAWLVGETIDQRAAVGPHTKHIIRITLTHPSPEQ